MPGTLRKDPANVSARKFSSNFTSGPLAKVVPEDLF